MKSYSPLDTFRPEKFLCATYIDGFVLKNIDVFCYWISPVLVPMRVIDNKPSSTQVMA